MWILCSTQTSPYATMSSELPNTQGAAKRTIDPKLLPKLDPALVKIFLANFKNRPEYSLEEIRADPKKDPVSGPFDAIEEGHPWIVDWKIPTTDGNEITARVYSPDPKKFGPGPYAIHINYHGLIARALLAMMTENIRRWWIHVRRSHH